MLVPQKTIWLAIHQIFTSRRVDQGCHLPLKILESDWKRTGLRRTDLISGLTELTTKGQLRLERMAGVPSICLVDESFGFVDDSPNTDRAIQTLDMARGRRRTAAHMAGLVPADKRLRRRADRQAPIH
ncbi:MAG: hypothetical protein ACPGZP_10070 [Panacagrimonas sp.]